MSITLVPVSETHIPHLCTLQHAAFLPLYDGCHDERNPAFKGEGELRRHMESPDFFPYAILEGDTVAGGITVKRLAEGVYYLARLYLAYHDTICERPDLIGASHHTLNLWRKR